MEQNNPRYSAEHEHENFLEEYIYLQAMYHEWEEQEHEELKKEVGRVHVSYNTENTKDESHNQSEKLPF